MINNGVVKFLINAKAMVSIMLIIVALVVWFVVMHEDVAANTEQLKVNTSKMQENKESIIGMKKDIAYIKEAVDMIYEEIK